MRINRLFVSQALSENQQVILNTASSHYLVNVLRLEKDSQLIVFDGSGRDYLAKITTANKKRTVLTLVRPQQTIAESPLHIHLGIGISKGDRLDWVLQKSTELGVNEITPLLSKRTAFKLKGDRLEKKRQHWQQITISACEQSGRSQLPQLNTPRQLEDWISQSHADIKLVLNPTQYLDNQLPDKPAPQNALLLIGPEGGLSNQEVNLAMQHGFQALTLGPRILRTETAPLAAISIIQYQWGDMKHNLRP